MNRLSAAVGSAAVVLACSGAQSEPPVTAAGPADLAPAPILASDEGRAPLLIAAPSSTSHPIEPLTATAPPGAHAVALQVLSHRPVRDCPMGAVAALVRGCRPIPTAHARATSSDTEAARAADGDACTLWNAGRFPPAAVRLEFESPRRVRAIVLVTEQTPLFLEATHFFRFQNASAGVSFSTHAVISTQVPYVLVLPEAVEATVLDVVTTQSPSWVAFREIMPLECDGEPGLPANAQPALTRMPAADPEPSPTRGATPEGALVVVPGVGSCASHDDCVRQSCCSSTCASRKLAKPCRAGTSCPASVEQQRCACIDHRCVTLVPEGISPGGH